MAAPVLSSVSLLSAQHWAVLPIERGTHYHEIGIAIARAGACGLVKVGVDIVEHDAEVRVQVPVHTERQVVQSVAPDTGVVQVDVRPACLEFPCTPTGAYAAILVADTEEVLMRL